jgi:hypothetical protein
MKITTKTICTLDQQMGRGPRSATKSLAVLLGLLILCSQLPACTSRSKPSQSPLDAEAQQIGEEYWFSSLTKCGPSYFGKYEPNDFTYQFNDVSVELSRIPPTEASRLDGVEWSGYATLRSKTSRMRVKKLEWDHWSNGSIFPLPAVPMKRINGRWVIDVGDRTPRLKGIDCSELK